MKEDHRHTLFSYISQLTRFLLTNGLFFLADLFVTVLLLRSLGAHNLPWFSSHLGIGASLPARLQCKLPFSNRNHADFRTSGDLELVHRAHVEPLFSRYIGKHDIRFKCSIPHITLRALFPELSVQATDFHCQPLFSQKLAAPSRSSTFSRSTPLSHNILQTAFLVPTGQPG